MTDLVESDPVPCAGSERLQRTVDDHCIDVGAPVSLWLEPYQRSVIHLPELDRQKKKWYTNSSVNFLRKRNHISHMFDCKCYVWFNGAPSWTDYILENTWRWLLTSRGWRVCVGVSHLKCKDTDHRFMITDAVLHVACVQVLSDLQRVFLILLYLLDLPNIHTHPLFLLFVLRGVFGS